MRVCTCVCLIPDVAVEDISEGVQEADHKRHHAEKQDSGQGGNALQHWVDPHPRHLVHPTRPEGADTQRGSAAVGHVVVGRKGGVKLWYQRMYPMAKQQTAARPHGLLG